MAVSLSMLALDMRFLRWMSFGSAYDVKLVKLSVSTFEHYVLAVLDVKLSVMLGWLRSHRCRGSQLGLDSAFESHRFRAIRSAMFRSP